MRDKHRFLADASDVLLRSLDHDEILKAIARLAVGFLAEWCVIEVVDDTGRCRQTIATHANPTKQPLVEQLGRTYMVAMDSRPFSIDVLRTGRASLFVEVTPDTIAAATRDSEQASLIREIGIASAVVVPLIARGQLLGALSLAHGCPKYYDLRKLEVAMDFARRAAYAIDNARLFQSAQDASRAKDDFLATISHELRQPLAACLGALSMMKTRKDRAIGEHARDVLERQIMQMARLVEDLLDASQVVRGHVALRPELIDLVEIVQQAVDTVRPTTEERQQNLMVSAPAAPQRVNADPARLLQVFVNVLSNAAKYSGPGGAIRVLVECDTDHALVRVQDTGQGIAAKDLPHIFDLFVRASSEQHGGFGIGLAVARRLIEQHGGAIEARSGGPGQGSEFVIRLPTVPSTGQGQAHLRSPQ